MSSRTKQFKKLTAFFRANPQIRTKRQGNRRPAFWFCGLAVLVGLLAPCSAAWGEDGRRVIWNFDNSLTNVLGGRYNSFSKEPSRARTYLDPTIHLSASGHSLRVTALRKPTGFCGVWFNFYPAASERTFDARHYPYLTFWIKGAKPGGDFDIKMVDAKGERDEDTLATRPLHAYLRRGIPKEWQKVTIPLTDFPDIDPESLARFVIIFTLPGDYQFYLDDIGFESNPDAQPAGHASVASKPAAVDGAILYHSMWVWKTRALLESAKAADRLFAFCSRNGLKEIYLSVDFAGSSAGDPGQIENPAAYGDFLSAAHQRGLRVAALAGAPRWAAGSRHSQALAALRAIGRYNSEMTPDARFDGIHFDVEPYLLLGFSVPAYRERILEDYLQMVAECAAAARQSHVDFTCDIPWWFYPVTSDARKQFTVMFDGKNKTVGEHVTDLLNSVTIMDYRNEADGAGGIVRFGIPALAYAAQVHKQVRIGLETSAQKDKSIEFVLAIPESEFIAKLHQTHLAQRDSFKHYSIYALHADGTVFIGLGLEGSEVESTRRFEGALIHLRKLFGAKSAARFSVRPVLNEARRAVAADPGWTDFRPDQLERPGSRKAIAVFLAVRRTPPITTFHGLGRSVFEQESRSTAEWLGRYPSFGGLAIHYYESFQNLMAGH
jgi:hypothetical protein